MASVTHALVATGNGRVLISSTLALAAVTHSLYVWIILPSPYLESGEGGREGGSQRMRLSTC